MKTYRQLYAQITSFENLYQAFKCAARGKRKKTDVAAFEFDLEENLVHLQEELQTLTYQPGAYHNFHIQDAKRRLISAAPFRDRVVHHALCQVIEPIFEARFIHDTYACRVGKGTHRALLRARQFARQYPYVLKCDIQHFFPNIDHEILRSLLMRYIADKNILWLIDKILASGSEIHTKTNEPNYFPGDDLFAKLRPRGLPIGNLTSQFWANVYLNPLDQFVKRDLKCAGYLRYVDDFLIFASDKATLHACRLCVMDVLAKLRLTLHENQAVVFPCSTGIPFLGWRVYHDHFRLKKRNGVNFQRRFAMQRKLLAQGALSYVELKAFVQGWVAHAAFGDTWGLRRAILSSKRV